MSLLTPERRRLVIDAVRPQVVGEVTGVVGLSLHVSGVSAAIGDVVEVAAATGPLHAEVVALHTDGVTALPLGTLNGVSTGMRVRATGGASLVPVGFSLLGRVLDGLGRPMDGGPELTNVDWVSLQQAPPPALSRSRVLEQVSLGVRSIDTMVPCGYGQRLGIFAGSGVGKSSLLSTITRGTSADVSVLALVGERGREVREFIENDLGPEGLARAVVVVATSDEPAMVRLHAAFAATRIAESFRDQGANVLLMMDSVTRVAMAQREIGLSAGEPPATRGYPPSVFSVMPRLLERAGGAERGSITGLYTVLVEGDDMNEPIGDTARSILDGHVVLSRRLASAGHFPAVDVLESVSRATGSICTPEDRQLAGEFRSLLAAYREHQDLIDIGAYQPGANPLVDRAIALRPAMDMFLRQDMSSTTNATVAWAALREVLAGR
jgi:flagellum-specific ATP synthase